MKLIGIVTGNYEGNMYAKLITTESFTGRDGCYGDNAVISKANYNFVVCEIIPNKDILLGEDVTLYYDRFGRVTNLTPDPKL